MVETKKTGAHIQWLAVPELKDPFMIVGYHGWSNAGSVSSDTLIHFNETLDTRAVAVFDQEEFLHFGGERPTARIENGLIEEMETSEAPITVWRNEEGDHDLVFFLGKEPQVLWRAYTEELLHAAQTLGISRIYTVGGVQDTVTHSAPAVVTVVGSNAEVVGEALGMGSGMRPGKYSGPISIHSRLLAACGKAGIPAVGLWGHVPAYLHKCPRLVAKLITLLARSSGADCSIEPLLARSVELDRRISEAVARDPELKQFVETIEGKKQPRPVSHKDKVIRLDECRKKDTPRTTE